MRSLALLFALAVVLAGIVAIVAPDRLMTAARYVITPAGLYAIAALRVGIGLVLIRVAPTSRTPRIVRALGIVVLAAGLATPLFGVDRSRAVVDWIATQGPVLMRSVGVVIAALGGFIAFSVAPGRRPA